MVEYDIRMKKNIGDSYFQYFGNLIDLKRRGHLSAKGCFISTGSTSQNKEIKTELIYTNCIHSA